jgi:glyoxylase-like metal-dependent hydrolase (beta-lactamase superfamily II)
VTHIIMTHLDKDHSGGLADFPHATVHVHRKALAALDSALCGELGYVQQQRYCAAHFDHGPQWQPFDAPPLVTGAANREAQAPAAAAADPSPTEPPTCVEEWLGRQGAVRLAGLPDCLLAVPLPGHAPGHCGVALQTRRGWLLHSADSAYHRAWLDGGRPPLAIQAVEAILQHDGRARHTTIQRLLELQGLGNVRMLSSHDPKALDELGGGGDLASPL